MRPLAAAVLIAAIVMIGATFTPFATQGCIFCPIGRMGMPYNFPAISLFNGLDGWIALGVAIALALAAAALVMHLLRRTAAVASLLLATVALALVIFEGFDAGGRVIGQDAAAPPVELGPSGPLAYVPKAIFPPVHLDAGFYVLLVAAAVALIAAAATVLMMRGGSVDRGTRDQTITMAAAQGR